MSQGPDNIIFSCLYLGNSEDEAVGWAYREAQNGYPDYNINLVRMSELPENFTEQFLKVNKIESSSK